MNKRFLMLISLLIIVLPLASYARPAYISEEQLMEQSELVISGEVLQVNPAGKNVIKTIVSNITTEIMIATIKVNKVIKGSSPDATIVIEFGKISNQVEADVQDAQFSKGNRGVAYLVRLPNGHYKALGGWFEGWDKGKWF